MDIIIAADENLIDHVEVPVRSGIHHTGPGLRFHVITRGVDEERFHRLRVRCPGAELLQYRADAVDHGEVKLGSWVSVSTMDRLRVTSLLPGWVGKAIYMDVDTVVMDDLGKMFALETGDCGIAAKHSTRKRFWMGSDYARQARVDVEKLVRVAGGDWRNFNAGVLLFDLDKFRANGYEQRTTELVEATGCNDQIALVMYSAGRHTILPDRWNAWVGVDHNEPGTKPYGILHYVGSKKPWNYPARQMFSEWAKWSSMTKKKDEVVLKKEPVKSSLPELKGRGRRFVFR